MSEPTREQLLALEPGQSIEHEGIRAWRPDADPRYRPDNALRFRKRYLEGPLTYIAAPELIRDILPEPWGLVCGELDHAAARQRAHHVDGTPVADPW